MQQDQDQLHLEPMQKVLYHLLQVKIFFNHLGNVSGLHKNVPLQKKSSNLSSIPANDITIAFDKIYQSIEKVLDDEQTRAGLIAFAGPQFFDEPIRFYF